MNKKTEPLVLQTEQAKNLLENLQANGIAMTPAQVLRLVDTCPWTAEEVIRILQAILSCVARKELRAHRPGAVLYTALSRVEDGHRWLSGEVSGAHPDGAEPSTVQDQPKASEPPSDLPERLEVACALQSISPEAFGALGRGPTASAVWAIAFAELAERPSAEPWGEKGWRLPGTRVPLDVRPLRQALNLAREFSRGTDPSKLKKFVTGRVEGAKKALDPAMREFGPDQRIRFKDAFQDWCWAAIHGSAFLMRQGALPEADRVAGLLVEMIRTHAKPEQAATRSPLGEALPEPLWHAVKNSVREVFTLTRPLPDEGPEAAREGSHA